VVKITLVEFNQPIIRKTNEAFTLGKGFTYNFSDLYIKVRQELIFTP